MFSKEVDKYLTGIFEVKYDPYLASLRNYEEELDKLMDIDFEDNLSNIKDAMVKLNSMNSSIGQLSINVDVSDLFVEVDKDMELQKIECAKQADELINKYEAMTMELVEARKRQAELENKELLDEVEEHNSKFKQLELKRQQLEKYNNTIVDTVTSYGITTEDLSFDTEGMSFDELSNLYDEGLSYMEKNSNNINPIREFREMFPDSKFQLCVIGIFVFISFTVLLDIIAIAFFAGILYTTWKNNKRDEFIVTLYALLYCVNPLEFCKELDEGLLTDVNAITEEDIEEAQELINKGMEEIDKYSVEAIEERHAALSMEMMEMSEELEEYFNSRISTFESIKQGMLETIKEFVKELKEEYERIINSMTKLGDVYNESPVMNTNFIIGMKDEVQLEKIDIGLTNLVIKPGSDPILLKQFLQVLLGNAFMSVKPGSLSVDVYDPNKFGQDILSFYSGEIENLFNLDNPSLDKLIDELKATTLKNMKLFKDKTINQYNEDSIAVGRTTKPYRLLLVLSQPKKIEEDEALMEFMAYSANYGVLVWVVTDKNIPNTYTFNKPFDGVTKPYPIDLNTFGSKISEKIIYGVNNGKTPSLMWDDFVNIAIPDEKFWTMNCDEFIDLDPGFWEGDPTQYQGYTVGNVGNVHVIGVGGTGAGKSVFLNNIIANATRKYSPKTLELWLIDFKGVEFKFYLGETMLPHIKACLCTSDGDYAGSVFKALRTEAERRYNLLKEKGHKNIYTYNTQLRREGGEDEVIKRILAINDEFQVIFEKADEKTKTQIIGDIIYISKVARAAGIHLFFASQSMKGTVSDDILQQFTLRFALRCDREVSLAVMKTPYAGDIKEKNGYLYARSVDDLSLEAQKLYRTPFIPDDMLREHIKRCADKAKEIGYKLPNVITYEEATIHGIEELAEFYRNNDSAIPDSGAFILGMRMAYAENIAPQNVILGKENNTHIVSAFSNTIDLVMFFKSMIENINNHRRKDSVVMFNSQIRDLHYLCSLDEIGDETARTFSNLDTDVYEYVNLIERMVELRKSNGLVDAPVYFFLLGWDKAPGFGVDKDQVLVSKLASIMQTCGVLNIHIILICISVNDIPVSIINAATTLIAGKCDENSSFKLLGTKLASKTYDEMRQGYMFVSKKGDVSRVKIYQSPIEREVVDTEIIIKG